MIRPEAAATLTRWREALAGAVLAAWGLWSALSPGGWPAWMGAALALAGAALIVTGVQRARFRTGQDGPGVVQTDEGRITYFGPLTGGMAALSDIQRIEIDPTAHPVHWRLQQPGQPPLVIPVTAAGAEALLDTFAGLPGFSTARAVTRLNHPGAAPQVVWQRPHPAVKRLPGLH